jgi:CheY-like chemotaxis protein
MSRTILVVDEDTDTRIILRALLERHGYEIIEAATAHDALAAAQRDLALVILNHPILVDAGTSLARWLRMQPATRVVPIINLTSRTVPHFAEDAARDGVTVSMAKPVDVQRMIVLVQQLTADLVAH